MRTSSLLSCLVLVAGLSTAVSADDGGLQPSGANLADKGAAAIRGARSPAGEGGARELLKSAEDCPSGDVIGLLRRALVRGAWERWVVTECMQIIARKERETSWRYDPANSPADLTLALARGWREGGALQKAADCYRAVLAKQPDNRDAAVGQILTLARLLADPRDLLNEVELALFRQPADVELRVAWADIQRRLGQKDRAMAACSEILVGHPDSWEARTLKSRLLVETAGTGALRLRRIEEALRLSENAPEIREEYIKALSAESRPEDALAQYDLLPDTFLVTQDLLKSVGRSLQAAERREEAVVFFSLALRKRSGDPSLSDVSVAAVKELVRKEVPGPGETKLPRDREEYQHTDNPAGK